MLQLGLRAEKRAASLRGRGIALNCCMLLRATTQSALLLTLGGRSVLAAKKDRPELSIFLAYNSSAEGRWQGLGAAIKGGAKCRA